MVNAGFFNIVKSETTTTQKSVVRNSGVINKPPVPGAKLGRDKEGNPAWFVPDTNVIGEYVKIDL